MWTRSVFGEKLRTPPRIGGATPDTAIPSHIVSYAIMSNHYHVIRKVDLNRAESLSDHNVIDRWALLYAINPLVCQRRKGEQLPLCEMTQVAAYITQWRENLTNISRYMGYLNERIARQANQEDQCKERFWEGRFISQALLDDQALLQCMAYVDLNPVRAVYGINP